MDTYFETTHNDGGAFPVVTAHKTFDEATAFAEAHGIAIVYEIGGAWDEFSKCEFCGEWFTLPELNRENLCPYCVQAIESHGG